VYSFLLESCATDPLIVKKISSYLWVCNGKIRILWRIFKRRANLTLFPKAADSGLKEDFGKNLNNVAF